jgi:hypothetical protein
MTDHPEYATCLGCTQGVRIDKNGRTRKHSRKVAFGYGLGTVECVGSYRPYAEASRVEWDAQRGEFVDMPIQVAATQHFLDGSEPVDSYVEVHCWPTAKAGHQVFEAKGMKLHLYPEDEAKSFRVVLMDAEGGHVREATKPNDGSVNGLVLNWMEQLAPTGATA